MAAGTVTVRGDCLSLAGTFPLLPVADALGELGRLEGGELLAAALDAAPGYAREEVGRLLPVLGPGGGPGPDGRDGAWSRERLFSGVTELLAAVAGRAPHGVGLVVEDVHWADSETLDFLTFLARAGRRAPVWVVVTCRADEAPLAAHVAGWLARVRADAGTEEIRLGPLSRPEVAGQATMLAGGPVSPPVIDELFARAEGNPFFTEQLVAAALVGEADGGLRVPAGLPARLAELLAARAGRCAGEARAVLASLAVAGRPLTEDLLGAVTGLEVEAVRRGLRELAAARLLAEGTSDGGHRPRHALLGEAVASGLLPGERAALHGRAARALAAAGIRRWRRRWPGTAAAGRPAEELPGRVAAAAAAERAFGDPQAAAQLQRAIELCQAQPGAAAAAGIDVPRLHMRAIDALYRSGNSVRAWPGRRGGLPPLRQPPRPRHRRRRPLPRRVLPPPRRVLPAERWACRRAAADGGGTAAVRAGSAVVRSRRRPARLRHLLPAARGGAASGQPHGAAPGAGSRRSGRRHRPDPPDPVRDRGRRVDAGAGQGGVRRP